MKSIMNLFLFSASLLILPGCFCKKNCNTQSKQIEVIVEEIEETPIADKKELAN